MIIILPYHFINITEKPNQLNHRIKKFEICNFDAILVFLKGNTFQNFSVSSPAAVAIFSLSGDMLIQSTRASWPYSWPTFWRWGQFHTEIALSENPWAHTNSLQCLENCIPHIWDPTFCSVIFLYFLVFQNFMHISRVPPPVRRRPC